MKKHAIISLCLSSVFTILYAQEVPHVEWAKAMGGTGSAAYGRDVSVDALSNVYATGDFAGTVDFNPGTGTYNLVASGIRDVFVSKLDANGNFVWAKSIGAAGTDMSYGIDVDAAGNIYITGQFAGTVDFDPGPGVFNVVSVNAATSGYYDIFILKLDTDGDFVWAKSMGGSNHDYGRDIVVDASGNVHLTGAFSFTVDFDPGPAVNNLIATAPGNLDTFVLKLDTDGNFVWARNMGSRNEEKGYGIALDASGNVYTTGTFGGVTDFDPGAATFNLTPAGNLDMFVSKLNSSGNFVWVKAIGGANIETGQRIIVDASGNVYATGNFFGTADFDPNAGIFNLDATGAYDVFILKLDTNGNLLWAKSTGGAGIDYGYAVGIDPHGNVYTTGSFAGVVDFNPGAGTFNLSTANPSSSYHDVFLSKLDTDGNFLWATSLGGGSEDEGYGIVLDASSNIYSTGVFQGTTDFDPSVAILNLTATASDIFVYKLSPPLTTPPTITSFAATSGPIGTTVIITGTNFSTTPGNNTVAFNGITTAVSASTATTIITTVPAGATTGLVTVTVGGETATSATPFTVTTETNNQLPNITTQGLATQIGGIITLDLVPLITTTDNNLDIGSIQVIVHPPSGAVAQIQDGILTINYSMTSFSGIEQITIIACNLNDDCATQQFNIEVGGDIIVYNAVSPNGTNPTLVIQFIDVLVETKKNSVTIFDRWQNEVWRGINYDNSTVVFRGIGDGGNELPTGTYFYKIDFTNGKKSQTGFISLKR